MKNTARTTVREGRQSSDNTYVRIAAAEQNCLQALSEHRHHMSYFKAKMQFDFVWGSKGDLGLLAHYFRHKSCTVINESYSKSDATNQLLIIISISYC